MKRSPEQLEHEVESIRAGMDPVIDELDHRRHELVDRVTEIRQHAPDLIRKLMLAVAVFQAVRMFMRLRANRRQRSRRRVPAY